MNRINIKSSKACAFCRYWYDHTNSCIAPKSPKINLWEYDNSARNLCMQKNIKVGAHGPVCGKYECKVPIM